MAYPKVLEHSPACRAFVICHAQHPGKKEERGDPAWNVRLHMLTCATETMALPSLPEAQCTLSSSSRIYRARLVLFLSLTVI